jgi:hypothetical protein
MTRDVHGRRASYLMLGALLLYLGLVAHGYHDGFFRHVFAGGEVDWLPAGPAVAMDDGRWSLVNWARLPLTLVSAWALGHCAWALRVGRPTARLASFATFFGLLLPQAFLYVTYLVMLRRLPIPAAIAITLVVWGIPALLLGSPGTVRRVPQPRVLLTLVAVAWIGLGAEMAIGVTAFRVDWGLYIAAYIGMILAACSGVGLLRVRTWSLFTGLGASIATSFALWWALHLTLVAALPPAIFLALTWPFWRAAAKQLRAND